MDNLLQSVVDAITESAQGVQAPPGATFAVAEGSEQWMAVSGYSDLDSAERLSASHYFDLASVSKVLTTLGIRRLFALGKLREDTQLGQVLGRRSGNARLATIDQLLRHRAGLAEWWPLYLESSAESDALRTALALPLRYAPGRQRHYSDLGMQALGGVLETVMGTDLSDAISHLVLRPLGIGGISAANPPSGEMAVSGPDGDQIERRMVETGDPYAVRVDATGFNWREHTLRGEIADGNAYHAYGGLAGHAGWFGTAGGLLGIAKALADPAKYGFGEFDSLVMQLDAGQGQGVAVYTADWNGRRRTFVGHTGFTGTMVAVSPASSMDLEVRTVLLTNRLHGRPAPGRGQLQNTRRIWTSAIEHANSLLHPETQGER